MPLGDGHPRGPFFVFPFRGRIPAPSGVIAWRGAALSCLPFRSGHVFFAAPAAAAPAPYRPPSPCALRPAPDGRAHPPLPPGRPALPLPDRQVPDRRQSPPSMPIPSGTGPGQDAEGRLFFCDGMDAACSLMRESRTAAGCATPSLHIRHALPDDGRTQGSSCRMTCRPDSLRGKPWKN